MTLSLCRRTSSITPHYDSMDQRDYMYYRTRWGLTGSADYKLNEGSGIYLRGLYSTFRNWGQKWVYTLNDGPESWEPGWASPGKPGLAASGLRDRQFSGRG